MARGRITYRAFALLLPIVVLAGCSSTPDYGGDPRLKILPADDLPSPDRSDLAAPSTPYFVGPFDKLTIDVFGIPELSKREVQVDASGRISFPLAGVVNVSGKTPGEIEELLNQQLQDNHVRNPQVSVNLTQALSQLLTVEGQVQKPGQYPVIGRMSLLRATALAGGTTEFSKLNDVVIFRTVKGERLAALYDLDAIRHGRYADPDVYANDVVMVGDSASRRLFKDLMQVVPALSGPLVIALDRLAK